MAENSRGIRWDFKQLRMEFTVDGKKHVFRGSSFNSKLKTITSRGLEKLLCQSSKCSLIQLCSLQIRIDNGEDFHCYSNGINTVNDEGAPEPVQALLKQYEELFNEPT